MILLVRFPSASQVTNLVTIGPLTQIDSLENYLIGLMLQETFARYT